MVVAIVEGSAARVKVYEETSFVVKEFGSAGLAEHDWCGAHIALCGRFVTLDDVHDTMREPFATPMTKVRRRREKTTRNWVDYEAKPQIQR
jgi:hypothetical protein